MPLLNAWLRNQCFRLDRRSRAISLLYLMARRRCLRNVAGNRRHRFGPGPGLPAGQHQSRFPGADLAHLPFRLGDCSGAYPPGYRRHDHAAQVGGVHPGRVAGGKGGCRVLELLWSGSRLPGRELEPVHGPGDRLLRPHAKAGLRDVIPD